jgi:thymidylate kinase
VSPREALVRELCGLVDDAVPNRVIVFGSLPPEGSDLDLLVRPPEEMAVREALRGAGLAEQDSRLVRLEVGTALEVELQSTGDWNLPRAELDALYAEATPLPECRRLVEPAPHHRLLILATRTLAEGEPLSDRRKARITRALAEDPQAWAAAAARARLWGQSDAVEWMRAMYEGGRIARTHRLRRRMAQVGRIGRRRGLLIAISGVDGAGKSFQAKALQGSLEALGLRARVEWIPLASNVWLDRLVVPLKRGLARFGGLRPPRWNQPGRGGLEPNNPGSVLRQRSRAINYGWATLMAAANGVSHAFRAWRHRSAGRVVVFDRYALDSVVRSRFLYGNGRPLRLPRTLIRVLSPRPDLAFFLDVPAATSVARKEDIWTAEELERQVELYRQEYERCGVTRLEGELPSEELAREILEATWRRLR